MLRNLRLLSIDDEGITSKGFENIDIISIKMPNAIPDDEKIPEGYAKGVIRQYEQHCINLAFEKELDFDLLTIDINFKNDYTDPEYWQYKNIDDIVIPSGLHHGLAKWGQRKKQDNYGNCLPLAWEIRSVTPELFDKDPVRRYQIARIYGIIRAIYAQPKDKDNENLINCILREHDEQPDTLPIPPEVLDEIKDDLIEVMLADLRYQGQRTGYGIDLLKRLLPDWQKRFLSSVEVKIRVNVDALTNTINSLNKKKGLIDTLDDSNKDVAIEICNANNDTVYGIRLWSIFANLIDENGFIDLNIKRYDLIRKGEQHSVLYYLNHLYKLCSISPYRSNSAAIKRVVEIGKAVLERIKECRSGTFKPGWDLWTTTNNGYYLSDRCMILIIRYTLFLVFDMKPQALDYNQPRSSNLEKMAIEMSLGTKGVHNRTFLNTVKESSTDLEHQCDTATQLTAQLDKLLNGRSSSLNKDWLREGLKQFLLMNDLPLKPNISEQELKQKAPGLFL